MNMSDRCLYNELLACHLHSALLIHCYIHVLVLLSQTCIVYIPFYQLLMLQTRFIDHIISFNSNALQHILLFIIFLLCFYAVFLNPIFSLVCVVID